MSKFACLLVLSIAGVAPLGMAATGPTSVLHPQIEHIAVWVEDVDKTAAALTATTGWRRHPIEFGVDEDSKVFGGMSLAFVDANGIWLELVQPTTPGPGMDLLKEKGKGALVELDMSIGPDFDKGVAELKSRGIAVIGLDGKPMANGGLLREWVMVDGKKTRGDERLAYLPMDVSRGTNIELFWEYPNGVMNLRDAMWVKQAKSPHKGLRFDHAVLLAADLEKTAQVYTGVLGLKRSRLKYGLRRDWMNIGAGPHAWIRANDHGHWFDIIAPTAATVQGATMKKFGDGAILELVAETENIEAYYDRMKANGVVLTAGDHVSLPAGAKFLTDATSQDKYAYLPLDKTEGVRILIVQRGPKTRSILHRRDAS